MTINEILEKRKSIHSFTDEVISNEQIEEIIEAGRKAPFAGLAQAGVSKFRHFFVIRRGSEIAEKIMDLVAAVRGEDAAAIDEAMMAKYPIFCKVAKGNVGKRPMDLFMAPVLVIAAERAGMPAREEVALGYVMSNMWMKATDMGIGMKLCSGVADVRDTKALQALLGLPAEEDFAFDGCNLGIAAEELYREGARPVPEKSVTYL